MGFAMGRHSRILHSRLCDSSNDSDTGLGSDTSAGTCIRKHFDSIYVAGDFAVIAAIIARADIRRQYRVEFFPYAASIFTSSDTNNDVYISPKSEEQSIDGDIRRAFEAEFIRNVIIIYSADNGFIHVPDISR